MPDSTFVSPFRKNGESVTLCYGADVRDVRLRYGVSLISEEQAERNLRREIKDYDLHAVASAGRDEWNAALGAIVVEGDEKDKEMFYTSLYRTFERPVCRSTARCMSTPASRSIPTTGSGIHIVPLILCECS